MSARSPQGHRRRRSVHPANVRNGTRTLKARHPTELARQRSDIMANQGRVEDVSYGAARGWPGTWSGMATV
jgi:hypothetical protein